MGTLFTVNAQGSGGSDEGRATGGHLQCPFCSSYDVSRLFVASVNIDSCECATCAARWDEECGSGAFRGRASRSSVLMPRNGRRG